jgi:DNA-binding PadR family transcriptional regulator
MLDGKRVRTKITKNFLELIILRRIEGEPAHGYRILSDIRKVYGVSFRPSTIYPLLNNLEMGGYIESKWKTEKDRPRKVYSITPEGKKLLEKAANSFTQILNSLAT